MSAKVTKTEARKVLKALKEYKGAWIMRQGVDAPFIPDADYKWDRDKNAQEIIWESGDDDWAIEFASWINARKQEYGLNGLHMEAYNSFILCISKW